MGYTHYWNRTIGELDTTKWDAFVDDVKKLHAALPAHSESSGGGYAEAPLVIRGGMGDGEPIFNGNKVWFNGKDEMSHETFAINRVQGSENYGDGESYFGFCKTARKPYDLLAQATLIVYKHHFGNTIEVNSDGDSSDWQVALAWVTKILDIRLTFTKLTKKMSK